MGYKYRYTPVATPLINMCEKFHYDRLRNDRALGNRKSDNNKNPSNKNNVRSHWGRVSGSKNGGRRPPPRLRPTRPLIGRRLALTAAYRWRRRRRSVVTDTCGYRLQSCAAVLDVVCMIWQRHSAKQRLALQPPELMSSHRRLSGFAMIENSRILICDLVMHCGTFWRRRAISFPTPGTKMAALGPPSLLDGR